jgi:glycosyltransferase involved in cell wall biosynthesis
VARALPMHVVGGAHVAHARNLGVLPDPRLAEEFGRAQLLIFPVVSELFGYAVAESLACGTPVLAFDSGGPSEQIVPGENGWLERTPASFVDRARSLFAEGVPGAMRTAARTSAERFGLERVAGSLLALLTENLG